MDLLHSTWFWVVIILAPAVTVIGILARLARLEPLPDWVPAVQPGSEPSDGAVVEAPPSESPKLEDPK